MAVSENFLKDLSFKESLTLDTSSTSWFYSFTILLVVNPLVAGYLCLIF